MRSVVRGGNAVGAVESSHACLPLHIELLLALVEGEEVGFGIVPGLVAHYLASLHFFVIEHVAGVHALDKVLHFRGIGGWHVDLAMELLLLVQLTGKLGDVGREVPDDTEVFGCLSLLERGDDAPFRAHVRASTGVKSRSPCGNRQKCPKS